MYREQESALEEAQRQKEIRKIDNRIKSQMISQYGVYADPSLTRRANLLHHV